VVFTDADRSGTGSAIGIRENDEQFLLSL